MRKRFLKLCEWSIAVYVCETWTVIKDDRFFRCDTRLKRGGVQINAWNEEDDEYLLGGL